MLWLGTVGLGSQWPVLMAACQYLLVGILSCWPPGGSEEAPPRPGRDRGSG